MTFYSRGTTVPNRVALFPGAYNPPTVAHLAIAEAAGRWADEVVWVLPRAFPHKPFECTTFDERLALLRKLAGNLRKFAVAASEGGLYAEIGAEAEAFYGKGVEIALVCGRDAAHRIATWDYGDPGFFSSMLVRHPLLVAARHGEYEPEPEHRGRIIPLEMNTAFDEVSSTEVRERLRRGEPWRHLVPDTIASEVERFYSCQPPPSAR